jgi:predicted GIY-YIG superfamily endonuclease
VLDQDAGRLMGASRSLALDAINLARLHMGDTITVNAYIIVGICASTNCTVYFAELCAHFGAAHLYSILASACATTMFWAAMWARFTRTSALRGFGSFTMVFIIMGWLLGGVIDKPLSAGDASRLVTVVAVVGCMWATSLISLAAIEERRTGSKTGHSLYRFYNAAGKLLYIGITGNPKTRFADHRKKKLWWPEVAVREICHYPTRTAVLAAERAAIKAERPVHNVIYNSGRG